MKVLMQNVLLAMVVVFAGSQMEAKAQPGGPNLEMTSWFGQEQLEGYGRLEFFLRGNGVATMVDAEGSTRGTYQHQGNRVILTFHNGGVVYEGTIQGNTLSGRGRTAQGNWTFSVNQGPRIPPDRPRVND